MTELITILGSLISSLGNVQSVSALKEHLALINTKYQLLKEYVVKLEEENATLTERNNQLSQKLIRQEEKAEFVESGGALFKRLPGGGFGDTPYCPSCLTAMSAFRGGFQVTCGKKSCRQEAAFKGCELKAVHAALK